MPSTLFSDRIEEEENSIAAMPNASISKPLTVAMIANNIAATKSEAERREESCLDATADVIFNLISDLMYSSSLF